MEMHLHLDYNKHFRVVLICMVLLSGCKNDSENRIASKIDSKKVEVAKQYFDSFPDTTEFNIAVQTKKSMNNKSYFFSVFPFDFVTKNDLPYKLVKYKENYVFLFDDEKVLDNREKEKMIKKLKKEDLLFDFENIDTEKRNLTLDGGVSWHCFVCKKDFEKIKIIKSPYILAKDKYPKDVCDR